jgi:hypothetical protein
MLPTSPEEAKGWIDLLFSYGPAGAVLILLVVGRLFGFGVVNLKKASSEALAFTGSGRMERGTPVSIKCPMNPLLEKITEAINQLSRQQERVIEQNSRLIEKTVEMNTHLEHLVDLHRPQRERTGVHERVRREDIPGA